MENSCATTIEEIKLQEQHTEMKLKENRNLESTLSSLNIKIREMTFHIEKSEKEQIELSKRIDKLRSQLVLEKIRRDALLAQIEANKKELEELKRKSDEGMTSVWSIRSSLCNAVHEASDNYDVLALLVKPKTAVPFPEVKNLPIKAKCEFERKLKEAMQRKQNAIKERDRLLNEPETGHEFIRIKNALEFSLEKIAILRSN